MRCPRIITPSQDRQPSKVCLPKTETPPIEYATSSAGSNCRAMGCMNRRRAAVIQLGQHHVRLIRQMVQGTLTEAWGLDPLPAVTTSSVVGATSLGSSGVCTVCYRADPKLLHVCGIHRTASRIARMIERRTEHRMPQPEIDPPDRGSFDICTRRITRAFVVAVFVVVIDFREPDELAIYHLLPVANRRSSRWTIISKIGACVGPSFRTRCGRVPSRVPGLMVRSKLVLVEGRRIFYWPSAGRKIQYPYHAGQASSTIDGGTVLVPVRHQ